MKRLHFMSIVQSKARWLLTITLLLTLGIEQVWAWGGMVQGCVRYEIPAGATTLCETDNTTGTQEVYTVSSFTITGIWITNYSNNNNNDGTTISGTQMVWRLYDATNTSEGDMQYRTATNTGTYSGQNREDNWTGTITPTTNSGEYYFKYYFESWFGGKTYPGNQYLPGNGSYDQIHYKLLPPNVNDFTVTPSGSIHGDGSSGNPYIVVPGNDLTLTLSGASQAHSDANSVAHYSVDGSSYGTDASNCTKTISNVTNTSNLSVTVYAKFYNSKADLNGDIKSKTIYYKADPHYNVTATYGAGGTSASPASATSTGRYEGGAINAIAATGYYFTGWTVASGSATFADSKSASTTVYPTAATTVQANFAPIWYLKGDFNSWGETHPISLASSTSGSVALTTTTAKLSNQKFRIWNKQTETYYQIENKAIDRAHPTPSGSWTSGGSSNDMTFTSDIITTYTFAITYSSNIPSALSVTYPTAYTVTFGQGTGYGSAVTASATSAGGSFSSGDYVAAGEDVTFTQSAHVGYTFAGWYTASSGGTAVTGMGTSDHVLDAISANANVYAQYNAKTYTVTLDQQSDTAGYKADGSTSLTATYDAAFPSITKPTAKDGWAFMGYWSEARGKGTQFTDENGALLANIDGYSDASGHWIYDDTKTLYAYYEKASITDISIEGGTVVGKSESVSVTASISPAPTGTTTVCWELQYSDGTPHASQPTFSPEGVATVSFTSPAASGSYKLQAILRLGTGCSGTELSTRTLSFTVAGEHTVNVQYKCGDVTVKTGETLEGITPLEWSDDITAAVGDDPFGYTFQKWVAGDGVTIKDPTGEGESTNRTIKIKANYDGVLTAQFTKDNIIYFVDNLDWTDPNDADAHIYVNLLTGAWWDNSQGTGNEGLADDKRNKQMDRVPGTTNIFYYNYGSTVTTQYVSFTKQHMDGWHSFGNNTTTPALVVYPTRPDPHNAEIPEYGFYGKTPMFVPVADQTEELWNTSRAKYYNKGYWTQYTAGTGYTLEVYNSAGSSLLKSVAFSSADELFPLEATADLEAGTTYRFQIKRDGDVYYTNGNNTMTYADHGQGTAWEFYSPSPFNKTGITTTAAGNYTFKLLYGENADHVWRLRVCVDYPVASGDYRLVYSDAVQTKPLVSAILPRANDENIASFFVRYNSSPVLKLQKCSNIVGSTVYWIDTISDLLNDASLPAVMTKDTIYNIILTKGGNGKFSHTGTEYYSGNYYIRTDCAGSKWDNYTSDPRNLMTYSEYAAKVSHSDETRDFTHYFVSHANSGTNVKYVVANDYSPNISDTLKQQTGDVSYTHVNTDGFIQANANVRFMWNIRTNALQRAYLADAKEDGTRFLVLQGEASKLLAPNGDALSGDSKANPGNNHGGGANAIQFEDKENWMYEANVKAVPGGRVKLYAVFHGGTFYYYGDSDASFEDDHAIDLVSGEGDAQSIRVIYDFKTDRLIAAWVPSDETIGDGTTKTINADIMLVRVHQESGKQINLAGSGKIETDKTVYGVMRFNRYTMHNRSTTGEHAILDVSDQKSLYERFNYMISFPFDVKLGEVFGFGTVGRDWRISYYDGLGRATEGYFLERGDNNWRMLDDTDSILHAYQGYLLQLNTIRMAYDKTASGEVWANNKEEVELYFPAKDAITTISLDNCTIPALSEKYNCSIDLSEVYKAQSHPNWEDADRRIKDSYWRCIGVPGFTSYEGADTWTNFQWNADADALPYLYEWQMDDNSLSVVSTSTFTFLPMHAYLIQNGNSFIWTSVAKPSSIVARRGRTSEEIGYYEFKLEMQKDEKELDHTFVRMTDKEDITANFDFGQDLSKELNANYNIYTCAGYERLAANNLPISDQTTMVQVGVTIAEDGDYTFSMPEGTNGVGVTLIDNETGIRTNLSALDYIVNLTAGTYNERFVLEISPIKNTPTGVEAVTGDGLQVTGVRKVMIDGILYIVKDGKMFDARGNRVK